VTAYTVHQRRLEVGIRIALGGTPTTVVRLILSRVIALVFAGVVIGSGLAVWVSSSLTPLLYGLGPHDRLTYFGAAAGVFVAGLLAGSIPAVRASRIDPALGLR
jgi:putative ABC transport system permease protein